MDLFGFHQRRHRERMSGTTAHEYKRVFRFTEDNVDILANIFLGNRDESRGHSLTRKQKLECFLRYVGDPGFQINVGEKMSVNQGTISRVIQEVAEKIVSKCKNYIHFPTTREERQQAQQTWGMHFTHPYAIGVIDGTLIPIQKPPARFHPDEYICRKGFHAINALVIQYCM